MKGKVLSHEYGLGTAYERYHFYQLIERVAREYAIESMMEGPVDGMAGVPGVHGVGLAKNGIRVSSYSEDEAQRKIVSEIYASCNAPVSTGVVTEDEIDSLPQADMVVVYHAFSFVKDWRAYLKTMAKKANKVLVVTVCNPENWGVLVLGALGRLRGSKLKAPEEWQTDVLAPALWEVGRLKEHTYFDCPWWPDLQVSPGQSLTDRIKSMVVGRSSAMKFTANEGELAKKHVYGAGRWPYFGGPGWHDELLPALALHPGFDGMSAKVGRYTSHLHAFVVAVEPRTPQGRKKRLRMLASEAE